jgi:1-acyl-sn-glycerol-3-phosphate acyltransferase
MKNYMGKRAPVVEIMKELEAKGEFDVHIDPIHYDLVIPVTEKFPYLNKTLKLKTKFFFMENFIVKPYSFYQNNFVMKTRVYGRNNLKDIKSAIITCNHIYMFDCLCAKKALKGHKLLITAGWFNNMNSFLGELMRADGMMPIPNDLGALRNFNKAMKHHMDKGHYVLFYPEVAEWWMYEKPRPFKNGAFHYAANLNVPVIPLFICFKDLNKKDEEGFTKKQFNIFILKPIYPKKELSEKENIEYLNKTAYKECVEQYEKFYQKKLEFNKN